MCIPAIHSLEQISSDEHVGSLAENLLEALRDDATIAKKVCSSLCVCGSSYSKWIYRNFEGFLSLLHKIYFGFRCKKLAN